MIEWRPVPDFPDYEVSDTGNVRSLARTYQRGTVEVNVRPRVLQLSPLRKRAGHLMVGLRRDNKAYTRYVHRLVCEAFHGPAPEGKPWALHRDDVKTHNSAGNLYWGSPADNMRDQLRNGVHSSSGTTHCFRGHRYDVANTYRTPRGSRVCRTCRLESQRERAKKDCPDMYHGHLTGYLSYQCRCPRCKEAWCEYSYQRRSRKK